MGGDFFPGIARIHSPLRGPVRTLHCRGPGPTQRFGKRGYENDLGAVAEIERLHRVPPMPRVRPKIVDRSAHGHRLPVVALGIGK